MDLIKKLPFSSEYNTILVIVNQLSKQAIFILTVDTITLHKLLFVIHIFSKNSVLFYVISDHGSEFVLNFFQSLCYDFKILRVG